MRDEHTHTHRETRRPIGAEPIRQSSLRILLTRYRCSANQCRLNRLINMCTVCIKRKQRRLCSHDPNMSYILLISMVRAPSSFDPASRANTPAKISVQYEDPVYRGRYWRLYLVILGIPRDMGRPISSPSPYQPVLLLAPPPSSELFLVCV